MLHMHHMWCMQQIWSMAMGYHFHVIQIDAEWFHVQFAQNRICLTFRDNIPIIRITALYRFTLQKDTSNDSLLFNFESFDKHMKGSFYFGPKAQRDNT